MDYSPDFSNSAMDEYMVGRGHLNPLLTQKATLNLGVDVEMFLNCYFAATTGNSVS